MTVTDPAPTHDLRTPIGSDGNAADVRYLEEASAALPPIMAACDAAAGRSGRHDVRALARHALTVQTHQLSAISDCLLAWGRPDAARPRTTDAEALVGLQGPALDRVFAARLTEYALASISRARVEMMIGASRTARPIAEHAIHAQDRQLAALDLLFPAAVGQG